jgi:hypothetical protein
MMVAGMALQFTLGRCWLTNSTMKFGKPGRADNRRIVYRKSLGELTINTGECTIGHVGVHGLL